MGAKALRVTPVGGPTQTTTQKKFWSQPCSSPAFSLISSLPSHDRHCLKLPQQLPVMVEATLDLTDDQIEQLLSAAEASLANKQSDKVVAGKNKQQGLAVIATATATATAPAPKSKADDGKAEQTAVKATEELSVRVPQLKPKKKKVCDFFVNSVLSFMMKANPKHE